MILDVLCESRRFFTRRQEYQARSTFYWPIRSDISWNCWSGPDGDVFYDYVANFSTSLAYLDNRQDFISGVTWFVFYHCTGCFYFNTLFSPHSSSADLKVLSLICICYVAGCWYSMQHNLQRQKEVHLENLLLGTTINFTTKNTS